MSRITSMISRIRTAVADKRSTRWSNDDIIDTINEGLLDFVSDTKSLRAKCYIEVEADVNTYSIKDIATDITRVQYLNKTLPITTDLKLTKSVNFWEDKYGNTLQYIVFDDLDKGSFKIYPKINAENLAANIINQNQIYGAIIDITTDYDLFNLMDSENIAKEVNKYMTVYYVKRPSIITIDTLDEDMELDADYDTAIVFYVTGMLLRGDSDAQNRSFSAEQLTLYGNIVIRAKNTGTSNNNSTNRRGTEYNGGF